MDDEKTIELPIKLLRQLLTTSNKMSDAFIDALQESHEDDENTIVFTNYVQCLMEVEKFLSKMEKEDG